MAKHPGSKSQPIKKDSPMNGAMKFFLVSCVAELYLLVVRRFYIFGNIDQVLMWDGYLRYILFLGAALAAAGVVLTCLWCKRRSRRRLAVGILSSGVFLSVTSLLIRRYAGSAVTFLCVLVPVVMLMGILWSLYDRECAWSLTILGAGLIVLWCCRKGLDNVYWDVSIKVCAGIFVLVLLAVVLLVRKVSQNGGTLGKLQILPAGADCVPIYFASGISALAVVLSLFNSAVAYYAMWALAVVIFALAVYYTVKQL